MSNPTLKTPILASIYKAFGVVGILGAALCFFMIFASRSRIESMSYIPLLFTALGGAIVCLGIAEIIMLIAKIAFHSERSADALCSQQGLTPAQAPAPASSGRTVAPAPKVSPVPTGFKLPAAKYFYIQDNEVQGPATVADIKNMIAMGLLPKDAQVAKEGTEDWMPISAASVV